jgi:hypothetical protein
MHSREYIHYMSWEVEFTDEFERWWADLTDLIQEDIDAYVSLLEERGPQLPYPYSSGINGSSHDHMRELRVQSGGNPIRIFYAFDTRRAAILLIGGDKTGNDRFYEQMIPEADRLYDAHLEELKRERGEK